MTLGSSFTHIVVTSYYLNFKLYSYKTAVLLLLHGGLLYFFVFFLEGGMAPFCAHISAQTSIILMCGI